LYQDTGAQISQNCSYIQSPGFPSSFTSSTASTLSYTVYKCSNDVCALRLDFETFTTSRGTTAAPTEDLTCGDVFTITVKSYRLFLDNEAAFFNRRHLKTISEQ